MGTWVMSGIARCQENTMAARKHDTRHPYLRYLGVAAVAAMLYAGLVAIDFEGARSYPSVAVSLALADVEF